MDYLDRVEGLRQKLLSKDRLAKEGNQLIKSTELKALYAELPKLPEKERAAAGRAVNQLRLDIEKAVKASQSESDTVQKIDLTAPFDVNNDKNRPNLLTADHGSRHPLMQELDKLLNIFYKMGFEAIESRQVDDDYHMFTSLNFPEGHPARGDYDTFMTSNGLIAPAHTSTMQNRVLSDNKERLEQGQPIQFVIPGRVYRNEDLDARHEHTFYQLEGVYVDKGISTSNLIATLKMFLETYYEQSLDVRVQPFYFPFTEPSFEFALSCPFCAKEGCNVCSYSGWIELLGCGMIHPNVLIAADIDPKTYSGFAWGVGIDRLVMMKNDIEDIRHFESGRLDFLRLFK